MRALHIFAAMLLLSCNGAGATSGPVAASAPAVTSAVAAPSDVSPSDFASYVKGMHLRIHRIFAESFLGSLDGLPRDHPMNDAKIYTRLQIVLNSDGRVMRMGVAKSSGVTAFDIAALDSVQRASPFGPAPSAIVSPDGRVHLQWEFHREEAISCSPINARLL